MSALSEIKEKFDNIFSSQIEVLRKQLFGVNNERLDFFMDSFYKLEPKQRGLALGGITTLVLGFVFSSVFLYFSRVSALQTELNSSFHALNKLRTLRAQEKMEGQKFDLLVETIGKKTKDLAYRPFFEKISKDLKVNMTNLKEDKVDMDTNNPLGSQMKTMRISMKLPNISLPKLLNFLIEIEKSGKLLRVTDLKIVGIFGNKLFFDVNIMVRGYTSGGGK